MAVGAALTGVFVLFPVLDELEEDEEDEEDEDILIFDFGF